MDTSVTGKPIVLIITEDIDFYLLVDHILQTEGFKPLVATTVEEAIGACPSQAPGAIVIDCKPHSFSGSEIASRLRTVQGFKSVPILVLVSPGAEKDHVHLLKCGVEDALTRPVPPARLLERLHTMLAQEHSIEFLSRNYIRYADVEIDPRSHRVRRDGKEIHLGPIEFKLLRHLMQTPEQVFSRAELISAAWPSNVYVGPRTVDVHMGRLRKALKSVANQDLIRTVRAAGYAISHQSTPDEKQSADNDSQ